jgi:hypothetical protein
VTTGVFSTLISAGINPGNPLDGSEIIVNGIWRFFVFTIFSVVGLLVTEISLPDAQEFGSRNAEVASRRSDDRGQMADDRGQMTDRGQMADDRGQMTDRGQMADDRGQMTEDRLQVTEVR